METAALTCDLLHYLLTIVAGGLCVMLFRQHGRVGWLVIAAAFLQPALFMIWRAAFGRPVLTYKLVTVGTDGLPEEIYLVNYPVLEVFAVIGLVLLIRSARNTKVV